jgi:hypothetical protein
MIEGSGSGSIPLTNGSGDPDPGDPDPGDPKTCGSGGSGSATLVSSSPSRGGSHKEPKSIG